MTHPKGPRDPNQLLARSKRRPTRANPLEQPTGLFKELKLNTGRPMAS